MKKLRLRMVKRLAQGSQPKIKVQLVDTLVGDTQTLEVL